MSETKPTPEPKPEVDSRQLIKLGLELGPLLAFLAVLLVKGIYPATAVLMVLSVLAVIASHLLLGHVSTQMKITTALVLGFGGLTLWLDDPRFIKVKPTVVNLLFAFAILGGLLVGKPLLRLLMGEALKLTDRGWHLLSIRFGVYFLVMAALNEVVWRNFSDQVWGGFKFAIFPLTLVFFVAQMRLIQQHQLDAGRSDGQSNSSGQR